MLQEQFESAGSQHACVRAIDQQCRLVQPLLHISGNMKVCSELFFIIVKINQI